jgi:hypothetical protein
MEAADFFCNTVTYPPIVSGWSTNAFNTKHKSQQNRDVMPAISKFSLTKI